MQLWQSLTKITGLKKISHHKKTKNHVQKVVLKVSNIKIINIDNH